MLYVDVGGTQTRIWTKEFHKKFPTNLQKLPQSLKKIISTSPFKERSAEGRKRGALSPTLSLKGEGDLIIGLRGVWTPKEKAMWRHKLRSCAKNITVLSDIELAHHLAFGNKAGVVVNAGTGSIAFGRNTQGQHARAGGLGPLIGDEGSAFWMGREYLKMLYQQDADVSRIRKYVAGPDAVSKIAALAKIVLKNAEKNPQSPESQIVSAAQKHLKNLILEVLQKLRATNLPIHITGGLFQNKDFRHRWQMSQSLF